MRISDWSSDVCSSDLLGLVVEAVDRDHRTEGLVPEAGHLLGDALEDGRPVEVETEVRARLAPGEDLGALGHGVLAVGRSEERRVGKEGVSPCSSRWSQDHLKKKRHQML